MYNIKIIYESDNYLVANKPAGIVIHNGAGEIGETLSDLILKKYPKMKKENWPDSRRPGIVHRLDKDTSGLLIVSKNPKMQKYFQEEFKKHLITKKYYALVLGKIEPTQGKIVSQITRDPHNRLKQKATYLNLSHALGKNAKSRQAQTEYKTIKIFKYKNIDLSLLDIKLYTGRMHQIRAHMFLKGYPVIGDQVYYTKESKKISDKLGIRRQFLHAYKLEFLFNNKKNKFISNLPNDLNDIIKHLK